MQTEMTRGAAAYFLGSAFLRRDSSLTLFALSDAGFERICAPVRLHVIPSKARNLFDVSGGDSGGGAFRCRVRSSSERLFIASLF